MISTRGLSRFEVRSLDRRAERYRRAKERTANDNVESAPDREPEHPEPSVAPILPVDEDAARALDKFYTRPRAAEFCAAVLKSLVRANSIFFEPSAGAGAFIDAVGKNILGMDIAPERSDIFKGDFLKRGLIKRLGLTPALRKRLAVIGNPPFGVRSSLACQFINKSLELCDTVGFILNVGMGYHGCQSQVTPGARLIVDIILPKFSFMLNGKGHGVVCRFQVWTTRPAEPGGYLYTGEIADFDAKPRITCQTGDNLRRTAPDSVECDEFKFVRHRGDQGRRKPPPFDLAIPFMKARDYHQQITSDPAKLNPNYEYWLVQAKGDPAAVIERLMQIDFCQIANRHNHRGQRYVAVDFMQAYERLGTQGQPKPPVNDNVEPPQRDRNRPLTYATVCSGIEGVSLAFEPLGMTPIFFSEIEAFPKAVLAHHWPTVSDLGDLSQIDGTAYRGAVDVLWGSLPCQSFSPIGNRKGARDPRGALSFKFVELADVINPPVTIIENTKGLLNARDDFDRLLSDLCGYEPGNEVGKFANQGVRHGSKRSVAWRILDAADFGLPQHRERLFVVAVSRTSGLDPVECLAVQVGAGGHPAPGDQGRPQHPQTSAGCAWFVNGDTRPKVHRERTATLRANSMAAYVIQEGVARRLLAKEWERIQGLNGDHTDIPWKKGRAPETLRKKAIGNGLAIPVVKAIGEQVVQVLRGAQVAAPVVPVYEMRAATVIMADNLATMDQMAPGSVDLIVTSPPYCNVGMEYGDSFDSVSDYVEFSRAWIGAAAATLKPTGGMWINVGHARQSAKDPTRVPLSYYLFPVLADAGLTLIQEVVWDRRVTQFTKHRFATQTERWMYCVKDPKAFTFQSDRVRDPSLNRTHHDPRDRPEGRAPSDLWDFSQVTHNSHERNAHPCQFPVAMIERIVLTCSNPGDVVMDPFAGSGTTGVAALKHGRKAVLIEREAAYCDIARARIDAVSNDGLNDVERAMLEMLRAAPEDVWGRKAA